MILIGQQDAGTLPDFEAMSQYEIKEYLNAIYNSLSISNRLGFFRTKDMNRQFKDTHVNVQSIDSLVYGKISIRYS